LTRCEECYNTRNWRNTGKRDKFGAVIRECVHCGHHQADPRPQGLRLKKRLLYYDIENTKMTVEMETFALKQNSDYLPYTSITKPPIMICWSAAWLEEGMTPDKVVIHSDVLTPTEARRGNDKRIAAGLRDLMNKADYLVGHNVKVFDTKKAHLRFLLNKMQAPDLSVKQLDTLSIAKKYFRNDSNTLGYWLACFKSQGKDEMRSEDWDLCKQGDPKALRKMLKYNNQDVRGGARVWMRFRDYLESGGVILYK